MAAHNNSVPDLTGLTEAEKKAIAKEELAVILAPIIAKLPLAGVEFWTTDHNVPTARVARYELTLRCIHCGLRQEQHAEGTLKCLFDATTFVARGPA